MYGRVLECFWQKLLYGWRVTSLPAKSSRWSSLGGALQLARYVSSKFLANVRIFLRIAAILLCVDPMALAEEPESIEDLFELQEKQPANTEAPPKISDKPLPTEPLKERGFSMPPINGFLQSELAYTWPGPGHWSKFRNLLELGSRGRFGGDVRWFASVRFTYDPIYDLTNFYPSAVRDDQRFQFEIRETYLDFSLGDWDFRLGRQHIIWGEMVGLFFADVVSAKDLRQFVLPDFDLLRIPQWALRAEYFRDDFHAEAVWIPVVTIDDIGKVGSEFYPFNPPETPGFRTVIHNDKAPPQTFENSAYGTRLSYLRDGWDVSLFYFSTPDLSPAFRRDVLNTERMIAFTPIHRRVNQVGMTLAKDVSRLAVFKAEAIYTMGRPFSIGDPLDADGLVSQDFLDYVAGVDFALEGVDDTRLNFQFFQRIFTDRDPGILSDEVESGASALISTRAFHPKIEPEVLYVYSFNHNDWMLQAKVTWELTASWRWVTGVDAFGGSQQGLFGRFNDGDRVYTEFRYSF
jgi:hypothetical protein